MSKASEAANKAYPIISVDTRGEKCEGSTALTNNDFIRGIFQQGYEQAEKKMIRVVKTWLSEIHRVCDITDGNGYRVELRDLVASLEKTMEEE